MSASTIAWLLELIPLLLLLNLTTIPFFLVAAASWLAGMIAGSFNKLAEERGLGSTFKVILILLVPIDLAVLARTLFVPQLVTLNSPGYLTAILFGAVPGYCLGQHLRYKRRFGRLQ